MSGVVEHGDMTAGNGVGGKASYRCDICNYVTTIKGNLRIHMQTDKHILTIRDLLSNVQEDGPEKSETRIRRCDLCGLETTTLYDQLRHIDEHYVQFMRGGQGEAEEGAAGALEEGVKVDSGYHEHSSEEDSLEEKPLMFGSPERIRCLYCNLNFKYPANLEIHMRQKHSELLYQQFHRAEALHLPNGEHPVPPQPQPQDGEQEYRCDICSYSTPSKHNLQIHFSSNRHEVNVATRNGGGARHSPDSPAGELRVAEPPSHLTDPTTPQHVDRDFKPKFVSHHLMVNGSLMSKDGREEGKYLACENESAKHGNMPQNVQSSPTNSQQSDQKHHRSLGPVRARTNFNSQQLALLNESFARSSAPASQEYTILSRLTGLPKRVVQVWFQNQRQKVKRVEAVKNRKGRETSPVSSDQKPAVSRPMPAPPPPAHRSPPLSVLRPPQPALPPPPLLYNVPSALAHMARPPALPHMMPLGMYPGYSHSALGPPTSPHVTTCSPISLPATSPSEPIVIAPGEERQPRLSPSSVPHSLVTHSPPGSPTRPPKRVKLEATSSQRCVRSTSDCRVDRVGQVVVPKKIPAPMDLKTNSRKPQLSECVIALPEVGKVDLEHVKDIQELAREKYNVEPGAVYIWQYDVSDMLSADQMRHFNKDVVKALSQSNLDEVQRYLFELTSKDLELYETHLNFNADYMDDELKYRIEEKVRAATRGFFEQAHKQYERDIGGLYHLSGQKHVNLVLLGDVTDPDCVIRTQLGHKDTLIPWSPATQLSRAPVTSEDQERLVLKERTAVSTWLEETLPADYSVDSLPADRFLLLDRPLTVTSQVRELFPSRTISRDELTLVIVGPVDSELLDPLQYYRKALPALVEEYVDSSAALCVLLDLTEVKATADDVITFLEDQASRGARVLFGVDVTRFPPTCVLMHYTCGCS